MSPTRRTTLRSCTMLSRTKPWTDRIPSRASAWKPTCWTLPTCPSRASTLSRTPAGGTKRFGFGGESRKIDPSSVDSASPSRRTPPRRSSSGSNQDRVESARRREHARGQPTSAATSRIRCTCGRSRMRSARPGWTSTTTRPQALRRVGSTLAETSPTSLSRQSARRSSPTGQGSARLLPAACARCGTPSAPRSSSPTAPRSPSTWTRSGP
mmetsp:Transcript_24267/g.57656  ORF Transcript_24267/g.57656 Transcript_24267/m.57656 type:complete len:211 (+) Transcript_24267:25-657(+)